MATSKASPDASGTIASSSRSAREEGAAWVATGHTADESKGRDRALFTPLARAAACWVCKGHACECRPLGERSHLIRPLLHVRRQTLLDYLHDKQIAYRIDSSNQEMRFTRNRIRHELLLPLCANNTTTASTPSLCRLAEQAQSVARGHRSWQAERVVASVGTAAGRNGVGVRGRAVADRQRGISCAKCFVSFGKREGWPMSNMDYARWQRLADMGSLGLARLAIFQGAPFHARRVGPVMQLRAGIGGIADCKIAD